MKIKSLLPLLFFLALTFLACKKEDDINETSLVVVGDTIPEFEASGPTDLVESSALYGKRSLIILFGSYCPDCQVVMPKIQTVWNTLKDYPEEHIVLPISRKESYETVDAYWNNNGYTMPYYLDSNGSVYYKFATSTIPRIYVVNSNGVIEHMWVEELPISAERLLNIIRPQQSKY